MNELKTEGKFIAFEGLDGSGTSTQASYLMTWLQKLGNKVSITREPTSGPFGSMLRLALVERLSFDKKTLAMLFLSDRMDHLYKEENGIRKLLQAKRNIVISERYYLSSFAYQTLESGLDLDWLVAIHKKCIAPDMTIFLDVPPDICIERIAVNRGLHFELFEKKSELEKIRRNYIRAIEKLLELEQNIQIVSGLGTTRDVEKRIRERILPILSVTGTRSSDTQVEKFKKIVKNNRLQIIISRDIADAHQIKISDQEDVITTVNIYKSGRVLIQGSESRVKSDVTKIVQDFWGVQNVRVGGLEKYSQDTLF